MAYPEDSYARRLLDDDPEALGQTIRWISKALTSPRFWSLRGEWPDLVQDVLARLIESLRAGRYDVDRDFRLYVLGIVRHAAVESLERAHRRSARGNPEQQEDERGERASASESASIRQLVRRVMDEASEECRQLMRAHYLDEKGYLEIAADLSLPVGTVKSRLSRCLESARRSIRVAIHRQSHDIRTVVEQGAQSAGTDRSRGAMNKGDR